ncbi:hypothetical protein LCGC14_0755430 [marine sediment metagenome]|uniref:Uncharacterized protein n=1 Tax=marine sediment metagenome TaxID=412755 RepID=A0A0F9Q2R3_9ZZZZ
MSRRYRKPGGFKFSDRESQAYKKIAKWQEKQKRYYCSECKTSHNKSSTIGKKHIKYMR